jgi:phosphate acetyltransferase
MTFIEEIKKRARKSRKTIVLPESHDPRTLEATATIIKEDFVDVVLIGDKENLIKECGDFDISSATFVNPKDFSLMGEYISNLVELRKHKGMTEEMAKDLLLNNPLYLGVMMVKYEYVDGMVAGACNSTANVLRPSLQIIKTAPNTKIVSTAIILDVPNCSFGANGTFVFSDCGLNQNPNSEELASIAASSASTFKALVGEEPIIAMLSHSTKGSASHPDVDKVIQATEIAKERYPEYKLDGELQLDAAIVPTVGDSKAPDSDVAGKANVLVFPDLDAANIGYKLVQRLAGAEAYGPMTQGLAKPVNDLSRGCSTSDIVGVVAITAVQAQI